MWSLTSLQIISYTKGSMSVSSTQFKGRVGFVSSMPSSDVSLYINNTQESDTGHYLCQIIIPNNPGLTGQVNLDVKGIAHTRPHGSTEASSRLTQTFLPQFLLLLLGVLCRGSRR